MFIPVTFDVDQAIEEGQQINEVVPGGNYLVKFLSVKRPKKEQEVLDAGGNPPGFSINIESEIIDGPFKGRRLFRYCGITVENINSQRFGRRLYAEATKACGYQTFQQNPQVILGGTAVAIVKYKPPSGGKDAESEVVGFASASAYQPATHNVGQQQPAPNFNAAPVQQQPVQQQQFQQQQQPAMQAPADPQQTVAMTPEQMQAALAMYQQQQAAQQQQPAPQQQMIPPHMQQQGQPQQQQGQPGGGNMPWG